MTVDDWRVKYDILSAETDRLRAEVERLREDAERARWCEENKADVSWSDTSRRWRVIWCARGCFDIATDPERNAALDAARGGH